MNEIALGIFLFKIRKLQLSGVGIVFYFFFDYAEEVRVEDNIVVSYNNDDPIPRSPYFLLSGIIVLIDIAFLLLRFWWIKHLQTLQDKRDKRIKKKYGKLK